MSVPDNIFKSTRTIDGVKVSDTLVYNAGARGAHTASLRVVSRWACNRTVQAVASLLGLDNRFFWRRRTVSCAPAPHPAVICPYCDDQCPSGQIGDVTPDQLQQSPSNFANLGQSAFVVPADANLTDAQVSAINTYLSKGKPQPGGRATRAAGARGTSWGRRWGCGAGRGEQVGLPSPGTPSPPLPRKIRCAHPREWSKRQPAFPPIRACFSVCNQYAHVPARLARCGATGNGIVVVGNADSWGGALDAMPVNRILARFGLRVTKTSGAETMGQADVYVSAGCGTT